MQIKQFFKPDKFKIIFTIVLFLVGVVIFRSATSKVGFTIQPFYYYPLYPLRTTNQSIIYAVAIIYFYLIACCINIIIQKIATKYANNKKKAMLIVLFVFFILTIIFSIVPTYNSSEHSCLGIKTKPKQVKTQDGYKTYRIYCIGVELHDIGE